MALAPTDNLRRSFLYRTLDALGATFEPVNGFAAAMDCGGDEAAETRAARHLGLADLSPIRRVGFKGWATADWLKAQGATFEDDSNRAYAQADGALILRLSPGEFVVLGDLAVSGNTIDKLEAAWKEAEPEGCYLVAREEASCWLRLSGAEAPAMFAKICAVDLRPPAFENLRIAQTNVARLNAIILRNDAGTLPSYDLLTDIASAVYLWDCLIDAIAEFDGTPVGLSALRAVQS